MKIAEKIIRTGRDFGLGSSSFMWFTTTSTRDEHFYTSVCVDDQLYPWDRVLSKQDEDWFIFKEV